MKCRILIIGFFILFFLTLYSSSVSDNKASIRIYKTLVNLPQFSENPFPVYISLKSFGDSCYGNQYEESHMYRFLSYQVTGSWEIIGDTLFLTPSFVRYDEESFEYVPRNLPDSLLSITTHSRRFIINEDTTQLRDDTDYSFLMYGHPDRKQMKSESIYNLVFEL